MASKWARRLAILATAGALLAIGLTGPASAQQQSVNFSGAVTAGQTVTLECPSGYMVEQTSEGPNASLSFYRNANHKAAVAEFVPPTSTTTTTASWLVPKGAKFGEGSLNCVPIITQTVTLLGQATGADVVVDCPAETPYLVSVTEVLQLDPAIGQLLSTPYTATETGVIIAALPPSYIWRVTMTCSSQPQ
jgi:hypothetical protein